MAKANAHRLDALGEQVHIGDIVGYSGSGSSRIRFGKVIEFTRQGVKLMNFTQGANPKSWRAGQPDQPQEKEAICKQPNQILLIRANDQYREMAGTLLREIFPDNW